ncbi:uncharacterized protein LOC131327287 [Rhododendron vialii]|uniref:uncharacterized protein LOC131327287 n=1 Tax=Rhododendron vialii TaxID=182163 RepID=UPI00265E8090|nr:uncharacterized protein LOC131327287 [Rhododendron vialii]XP_058216536.1 uncharacterized protein LOC131327287 [Rhododendron vialii]XP_058216607.1 uncharacterized protein LOC131327287 [Rhododendron vialii]
MGSSPRAIRWWLATCSSFQFSPNHCLLLPTKIFPVRRRAQHPYPRIPTAVASALRSPPPVSELAEEDILQTFLKERELDGDIISKVSDILWLRNAIRLDDAEADVTQQPQEVLEDENEGGFLKLTRTLEWIAGDNSAPVNKKMTAMELQNDRERTKMLNLLRYEALKREMMLLTAGIGTVCSGYCLVVFSVQAALSYAAGVLFSCLYVQLLYKHADNLSKERVPQIFRQKKSKKIGTRSQDLEDAFERLVQGSGIALSSPRLVIPAAIYGCWGLSQHFASDFFDFQLVPAMVGMFAYKAAALVQVYRDNEDLRLIFPDNGEESSD